MNIKIFAFAVLASLLIVASGCVNTVTGRKTPGVPLVRDRIESRYERPLDQVYEAAKEVITFNGTLVNEGILHGQTNVINNVVKTVEGRINQRRVWVRVEQLEPRISNVTVQTRTPSGRSDIELAAEIDKQIALRLVR